MIFTQPITWIVIIACGIDIWYEDKRKEKERVRAVIEQQTINKDIQIRRGKVQLSIQNNYTRIAIDRNLKLLGILRFVRKGMCPVCYESLQEYVKDIDELELPKGIIDEV